MALWTYLMTGLVVVCYVFFRCAWWRYPRRRDRLLWPPSDNRYQILRLFFDVGFFNPIVFLIEVALWPLWLAFLWVYAPEDDDANI